jgi:DNA-binding beta-propeller fold protein YncE
MALPCGDFVFQVAFDPSGKYLFVSDGATNTTPILEINTTKKTAKELNDYLPGYVTPTFSHDGKIVYAQYPDNTVLINTFNPATGELGDNYTLSVSNGATITAW